MTIQVNYGNIRQIQKRKIKQVVDSYLESINFYPIIAKGAKITFYLLFIQSN
jgi:hypothetical protein